MRSIAKLQRPSAGADYKSGQVCYSLRMISPRKGCSDVPVRSVGYVESKLRFSSSRDRPAHALLVVGVDMGV